MIIKYKLEWKSRNFTGRKGVETIWVRMQIETNRNVPMTLSYITLRATVLAESNCPDSLLLFS